MAGKHCVEDDDHKSKKPKISIENDLKISKTLSLEIKKILDDEYMTDFEKDISLRITLLNDSIKRKKQCFSYDLRKQIMNEYLCKSLYNFAVNFDGEINNQTIEDLGL